MIKVVILEDDERVVKLITMGLTTECYQVASFTSINDLTDMLQEQKFDVLIMDRMVGKTDAIGWVKTIKNLAPSMKILILSGLSGSINRIRGLESGADDYLEKPFQYQELSLRLKNILKKYGHIFETVIEYEDIIIELDGQKMQRDGKNITLSPYEFKLMILFMKKPKKIHSRAELLDSVWGYSNGTSSNVVDVAVAKLRRKINFENHAPLIHSRRGSGYILSEISVHDRYSHQQNTSPLL